jgi:hypothetical protein
MYRLRRMQGWQARFHSEGLRDSDHKLPPPGFTYVSSVTYLCIARGTSTLRKRTGSHDDTMTVTGRSEITEEDWALAELIADTFPDDQCSCARHSQGAARKRPAEMAPTG